MRDHGTRLAKAEITLTVLSNFVFAMASIFAATLLSEKSDVNAIKLNVASLADQSKSTSESVVTLDREVHRQGYCLEALKPEVKCLNCLLSNVNCSGFSVIIVTKYQCSSCKSYCHYCHAELLP